MAVIQPYLEIPNEFIAGIESGEIYRDGGVLRHSAGQPKGGQFVKFLEEVSVPEATDAKKGQTAAAVAAQGAESSNLTTVSASSAAKNSVGEWISSHKAATAGISIGLVAIIGGAIYGIYQYYKDKKVKTALAEEEKLNAEAALKRERMITKKIAAGKRTVNEFVDALVKYLNAVKKSNLTLPDIQRLSAASDKLEQSINEGTVIFELSEKEIKPLIDCVIQYTVLLAKANSYCVDNLLPNTLCTMQNLKHHLKIQQRIFEYAA